MVPPPPIGGIGEVRSVWKLALPLPTTPGACPRAAPRADPWGLGPPYPPVRERSLQLNAF